MYIYIMKIVYAHVLHVYCVYVYIMRIIRTTKRLDITIYIYIRFCVYATPTDGGDVNINIILLYTHTHGRTGQRRAEKRLATRIDNVRNIGTRTNSKLVTGRHTRSEQDAQKHYCKAHGQRKSIPHVAVNRW
jgi:hypothetical protein